MYRKPLIRQTKSNQFLLQSKTSTTNKQRMNSWLNDTGKSYCPLKSSPNVLHSVCCSWWAPVHTFWDKLSLKIVSCSLVNLFDTNIMHSIFHLTLLLSCSSNCHPRNHMKVSSILGLTSANLTVSGLVSHDPLEKNTAALSQQLFHSMKAGISSRLHKR